MSLTYDAIIIGAGHNGLTAAAYLARAGRRVLVLERREIVGGACVTEEVWPGYRVSSAAYLCSLLHPRIIDELELRKHGFHAYRRETSGFAPFDDRSSLLLYADAKKTYESLRRFCPEDADAYFEFEEEIEQAAEVLEPFFFGNSPTLDQLEAAYRMEGLGPLFNELFRDSVRAVLERRFKSERLMAVLATDGLIGTYAGVGDPGTAYVMLHHYMGRALGPRGLWGYVQGGMGRISEALADSARTAGAEIRTNVSVNSIVMKDGQAAGVVLDNGDELSARCLLSNAHPAVTNRLAGLPQDSSWKTEGVSCKINLAVTELPDFTAVPGKEPGPQHLGTVHLSPSMDFLDRAWQDARNGRPSEVPMVEMYIQTATDRNLAPEGRHILSCFTQYFPYTLSEGLNHDAEKESYVRRVIDLVARHAPNVPKSIEAAQVLTPLNLEQRFGLIGGNIFHGDIMPAQMFGGRSGPKMEIEGLYLCGSGAFPGGCVSGVPGYNAAKEVLHPPAP